MTILTRAPTADEITAARSQLARPKRCRMRQGFKAILRRLARRPLPGQPGRTWLNLVEEVALRYGVTPVDMVRRRRYRSVSRARHEAWIALRELGYSYHEVARAWDVDHTTVMGACGAKARARRTRRSPVRLVVVHRVTGYELRLLRGAKKLRVLGARCADGRWLFDALHARSLAAVLPAIESRARQEAA